MHRWTGSPADHAQGPLRAQALRVSFSCERTRMGLRGALPRGRPNPGRWRRRAPVHLQRGSPWAATGQGICCRTFRTGTRQEVSHPRDMKRSGSTPSVRPEFPRRTGPAPWLPSGVERSSPSATGHGRTKSAPSHGATRAVLGRTGLGRGSLSPVCTFVCARLREGRRPRAAEARGAAPVPSQGSLAPPPGGTRARPAPGPGAAYDSGVRKRATTRLRPTSGNSTVSLALGPTPSTWRTTPTPNCWWRTFMPRTSPSTASYSTLVWP